MENSSFGRLIGVLVSPVKTFRSIAERPTWAVAFIVLALLGAAVGFLVNARTDQREMIQKQMEKFGRQMTEEQLEEAVERAEHPSALMRSLSIVTGLLGQAVAYLFPAFLYWVIFKLVGSEMGFKSSFSTYLHSCVPIGVAVLLTIPVILSRASVQPLDALTGGLLASSPAFLLPEGTSAAVKAVLASFDIFNLWSVVLAVLGYRIVARVSTTAAVSAAVLLFLLGMGIRVGLAALFG
jgi:Yip1-like protein